MRQVKTGPIIVASDRGSVSEAAYRAAALFSKKLEAKVRVVAVVEPLPVMVPKPSKLIEPLVASPALMDAVHTEVTSQIAAAAGADAGWPVWIEYGRPSKEIARVAKEQGAQLIVIGLTQHGVIDRILDGDTALEIVRHSDVPVLLASGSLTALPERAVFAVDFSEQSMDAARAGIRLLADGAVVHIAHVKPRATVFDGTGLWEEEYQSSAEKELVKFASSLDASGVTIETVVLDGSPARTLMDFAESSGAQLIVAATRGAGLMERILVGSVATRLMRHTKTSMLIVPDAND